ncbi:MULTISPECIES: type II toxin-antitoxin system antitoxin SocA domain-containing protein [unclassified Methylophaga]|jgi:uncharacterized phage-associated protein|uniref:Panacea domain-containing protein n=1 Tax=unclassified Methylophaga TaxID=2629249 RepID=UPI000C8DC796|nr:MULTISPECIES: type II toxin-antitoxin system antitoxin SocA domain-containing protein [unclassified Methylophaga]MAK66678.1 hypothetical protein [Methylophaga sp.]MAY17754.1 hypothetical protein [Methylophaga sp.]HAO24655.1 hypothetical protein [Methylophaga sp.]|tara:strand:- start:2234 stop:2803 length:570 start_codon:yes stop_codon:yes gene_type:complete
MLNPTTISSALLQKSSERNISVSNLKLQKLAYYCQGYYLAATGEPMFIDRIEAWDHGPVVPSLYHTYKIYGSAYIPGGSYQPVDLGSLPKMVLDIIDFVLDKWGNKGAWFLRNQTHQEAPWREHYNEETEQVDGAEISHDQMRNFFIKQISEIQDTQLSTVLDSVDSTFISLPDDISTEEEFYKWIQAQ